MINRRQFHALAAGALAAPMLAVSAEAKKRKAPAGAPNVLFIVIDDANNFNDYQNGYAPAKTPNLKWFAETWGTGFRRAYAAAPYCLSSRVAMLMGQNPYTSGCYDRDAADWFENPRTKTMKPLPRYFRDAGFKTFGTGKVFHDGWRPAGDNPDHSDADAFDVFRADIGNAVYLSGGDSPSAIGPTDIENAKMEDVWRTRWLIDNVLRKDHDKPFFAALGLRKTHLPLKAPQKFFDRFERKAMVPHEGVMDPNDHGLTTNADMVDLPPSGIDMARTNYDFYKSVVNADTEKKFVHSYLACYSAVDDCLGMIRDDIPKNTIVCIVSDHGWHLMDKVQMRKFTLWEQALLVPCVIGGPGIRKGATDALFSLVDVFNTLTDLAGVPADRNGKSHAAFLRGGAPARTEVVSSWRVKDKLAFAVRDNDHRAIFYGNGDRELYDHRVDPHEWNNIAAANPVVLQRLAAFVPANPTAQIDKPNKNRRRKD